MGMDNKLTIDQETDPGAIRKMIMDYLDQRGARHAMVGYPYAVMASEYLITHPDARAHRRLRTALDYVASKDPAHRSRIAIDRCIRTMIGQMNEESTVKELVFAIVDYVCLVLSAGPDQSAD